MIGDLIIWFKRLVKQHITCRHDYSITERFLVKSYFEKCSKCGKYK